VANTYQPTQPMLLSKAFQDLTRRVREDQHGGVAPLNDALGKGIRLIIAHRVSREDVEDTSRRVLELVASHLRADEIEPDGIPGIVVSFIHRCSGDEAFAKKPNSGAGSNKRAVA